MLGASPTSTRPADHAYDYAVVRVVPHVCLGGGAAAGVVLHARTAHYLGGLFLSPASLRSLSNTLDLDLIARTFDAYGRVCEGGEAAAPIGLLPASERFHWLTAPRSAVIQPGPVRGGRATDPGATLRALFDQYCGRHASQPTTR